MCLYKINLLYAEEDSISCTAPKCGELSEYTERAHNEVDDYDTRKASTDEDWSLTDHTADYTHPYISIIYLTTSCVYLSVLKFICLKKKKKLKTSLVGIELRPTALQLIDHLHCWVMLHTTSIQ